MDRTNAIIIAGAIVFAAFIFSGIYHIVPNDRGSSNVVNKFTGATWFCTPNGTCREME